MANKYNFKFALPPALSTKWASTDSLGTKIEKMFIRFIQSIVQWGYEFFAEIAVDIFDASMKIMRPGIAKATDPIIREMLKVQGTPEWYRNALNAALTETGESSWIMKFLIFYTTITTMMFGGLDPIRRIVTYRADNEFRSYLPSPQELATLHRIGLVSDGAYKENMGKLGVADPLIPVYHEYTRNLPSMGELFNGLWRGKYSKSDFTSYLKRMGYDDKDSETFLELTNNLPPLNDLIHMLVRDAFNDNASRLYGYDEDFPTEINEFFEKQGYSKDWAKRYWRSHWNLPSPTQGYEMLHRGLIDKNELDTLLRISDYPPFWREKLRDISYNVMTRVDVRRLLQAGLIDAQKAEQVYNQMGYTPDDAKLLTQFAMMGISQDERDLTKTEIQNLYEEGLTDRGATAGNLVKMGYDAQEAENIMQLSDVAIAKAARADLINYSKERFLAKAIDENAARSELAQAGLKAQSIDRYILNWQRATEIESALPSMADIKKWYAGDYIDEMKFRAYLAKHRHTTENIEIYVKQANDTKASAADETEEAI